MGKPFKQELQLLLSTFEWANDLNINKINEIVSKYNHPVYVVGSGGSLSACVYAADLLTSKGIFAKAVTPLELFYSKNTIRKSNLIFISASGNNTDILFAFKKAIECEPVSIISICMRKKSKLSMLAADYSICSTFEFEPPTGKDGFLATNSLVAYFTILYKVVINQPIQKRPIHPPDFLYQDFLERIDANTCFIILYGSNNHAVAVDLESKLSEAGLAASLISDYRHFAHGRHQWFDKKRNSAIIALNSPDDEKLSSKTLDLLPVSIPKLILKTDTSGFEGTLDLLMQAMWMIKSVGDKNGIDPGRPGVPEYGSKIYHLRYERLVANKSLTIRDAAIIRKAKVNDLQDLNMTDLKNWQSHYEQFIKKISNTHFGSLIFDYDGTLCSSANRFDGIGDAISTQLVKFIKKGFVIGIISGRGKSLRTDLRRVFGHHPELMKQIVIGYYNGSDIATLTNDKHPDKQGKLNASLEKVKDRLDEVGIIPDISPNQLTFGSKTTDEWSSLKDKLLNELMLLELSDLTMVESSHSIDIIPRGIASKNNILTHCRKLCKSLGLSQETLCIGDKGQWPGNDYALLSNPYSLSVGEVSSNPDTGWNICPPGLRDEKAVGFLLDKLDIKKGYFTLKNL